MPNAYPSQLVQLLSSTEELIDDAKIDRAVGGSTRIRALYTSPKRRFKLRHKCDAATFNTYVLTFYLNNRALTVSLTWARDGVVYTVLYDGAPIATYEGPNLYSVEVTLVEQ